MTVEEFCNWMREEIKRNPDIANYDLMAGDEQEYNVGAYEIEISHIKKEVIL